MTKFRPLPPQAVVRAAFHYDPATGILYRNGKETGYKRTRRGDQPWMILCYVDGVQYAAHRVIWLWVTGIDPASYTIDHVDRNPFNNKWSNLRLADAHLQAANREWKATAGHKGISFHKASGKWVLRRRINGVRVHCGLYPSVEAAQAALRAYGEAA